MRTTMSRRPFRRARNIFQCFSMSLGTLAETFGEEELTILAQDSPGHSGSQRGLSGGVREAFASNLLNSSFCCFTMAPLWTLCLRRGIIGFLIAGSSDRQTVGAILRRNRLTGHVQGVAPRFSK